MSAAALRVPLLVLCALLAAGCSRCGPSASKAPPVERVLPKGAVGVVIIPSLAGFGQKLKLLEQLKVASFLAPTQGFADSAAFADALVGELGIDVRSPEALEAAGLDGSRAMGAAALISGQLFLALPVKDAGKFDATLAALAKSRLGASVAATDSANNAQVKTFAAPNAGVPRLGYVLTQQFALVAREEGISKLAGLSVLGESDALSSDSSLTTQLTRVAATRDALLYLPTGSPALAQVPFTSVLASLSLDSTGLRIAADGVWKGEQTSLAILQGKPSTELTGFLPRDAFLVARYQGDPSSASAMATRLFGPHLTRAFNEAGFDPGAELLARLEPGVVASLSLAERPPLGQGLPSIDIRQTNPFSFAHLSGVATVKAGEDAVAVLEKLATIAPKFGAELKRADRAGTPAFLTSYAQGEGVHVAFKAPHVFFGSPVQRLDALLAADGTAAPPVAGFGAEPLEVVLDLRRLVQSVRALPESAWGLGGFAMKATTVRWLDATDDLRSIALAVGSRDSAVQARLTLSLAIAPVAPAAKTP